MIAKPIVKLIDEAIIPALVMISAKVAGVLVASFVLKIDFQVVQSGFFNFMPSVTYASPANYVTIENYSNFIMFMFVALGTLLTVIKAHHLHESHIHPKLHQKLTLWNLEKFVYGSFHIYHQAAIWLIFLWLTTIFLLISTYTKVTYIQVTLLAIVVSANLTWIFANDVQKEVEIAKNK